MSDDQLRVLLNLVMVCDPWPLSDTEGAIMDALIQTESVAAGYHDWIDAYHRLPECAEAAGDVADGLA